MRNIKTSKKENITNLSKTQEKFSLPLFLPFLALLLSAMLIGCAELNKAIEDMNQQLANLNPSVEQLNSQQSAETTELTTQNPSAEQLNSLQSAETTKLTTQNPSVEQLNSQQRAETTELSTQNPSKEEIEAKKRYNEFIAKIDSLKSAEEIFEEADRCNEGIEREYCINKAIEKDYVWARLAFIGRNFQKKNEKQNDDVEKQINAVLASAKGCDSEDYINSLMNMCRSRSGDFPQGIHAGDGTFSDNIDCALDFLQRRLQNNAKKELEARINDESFIYPVRSQCNSEYPLYKDFKSGMNKAVCMYYIFDSEEKKIPNMKGKMEKAHESNKLGCYISSCGPTSINMDKNDNIPYVDFIFAHKQKNAKDAVLVGVDLQMLSGEITFEDLVEKYAKQFNVTPDVQSKFIKTIDNFTSEVSIYEKSVEINVDGISCKIYATTTQVKYTKAFEMLNDGDKSVTKERLKSQLISLTRIKTIQILDHNQLKIFQDLYKEAKAKEDAQKQKALEEKKQKALDF